MNLNISEQPFQVTLVILKVGEIRKFQKSCSKTIWTLKAGESRMFSNGRSKNIDDILRGTDSGMTK